MKYIAVRLRPGYRSTWTTRWVLRTAYRPVVLATGVVLINTLLLLKQEF